MPARDFTDLLVWQKSVDLIVDIYQATRTFPPDERFGLTSQLRKASVSVPTNVAEGHGRATTRDYLSFVVVSRGSINEVRSLLHVSQRLGFLAAEPTDTLNGKAVEIGRMLSGLRASLQRRATSH